MNNYWVSFFADDSPQFEYHGPWWVSGCRENRDGNDELSIVAAVRAENPEKAEAILRAAFDAGHAPTEWRFTTEKPSDWSPLTNAGGRFPPADWMQWPWPEAAQEQKP